MPSKSLSLVAGMVAAVLGLGIVTAVFLVGVWAVLYGVFLFVDVAPASHFAAGSTALLVLAVGYLEHRQIDTIERVADAERIDKAAEPALYELVTRVATRLDIPVPTIALSERQAPEALVVGFRPGNAHLILSRGTLDALEDPAELEAVIAHELAHVKNRDAMVMTVVSLPVVLAKGLATRLADIENPGWAAVVIVPLGLVSTFVWGVGKGITARLSRVRERAADRVAAEITGSPAALASALKRLDREISETPNRDLRAASGISSLSILSLDPEKPEKVMLGPEGDTEPSYWWLRTRLHRFRRWLFRTHPPTDDRLDRLAAYERSRER